MDFKGKLYCFHRGADDTSLWYCTLNAARDSWIPDIKINVDGVASHSGFAAAVLNDRLHLVCRCTDNHEQLNHFSSTDGINWRGVNHPTPEKSKYMVMHLNFSQLTAQGTDDEVKENFTRIVKSAVQTLRTAHGERFPQLESLYGDIAHEHDPANVMI